MNYYTGVGSRNTPQDVCNLMERLAERLASVGYTLRSGGADGADTAFYNGAKTHALINGVSVDCKIYLPWIGFNGFTETMYYHSAWLECPSKFYSNYKQAEEIASEIHPAWDRLTRGPKALHTRNVYQFLGCDLNTPSDFLFCWAEPTKTGVKGGTNTAWQLAKIHGRNCYNLYKDEDRKKVEEYLD